MQTTSLLLLVVVLYETRSDQPNQVCYYPFTLIKTFAPRDVCYRVHMFRLTSIFRAWRGTRGHPLPVKLEPLQSWCDLKPNEKVWSNISLYFRGRHC